LELAQFRQLRDALSSWSGELIVAKAGGLPEAALGFESKFQPGPKEQVASAKAELQAAVKKLDAYLAAQGANGEAWKKYLFWKELNEQLAPDSPDARVLAALKGKVIANKDGLELPVFANVGDAIVRYINALGASRDTLQAEFAEQLKGLSEELKAYIAAYSPETAEKIGTRLGWLTSMGQVPQLVQVIRDRISKPNLFASVSSRVVVAGLEQPVDDTGPVRDVILGTDISGTARTVGNLKAKLIPSEDGATIETTLVGTAQSRTVGYNGPATIQSLGTTELKGTKQIVINEKGFFSYPAKATASTRTRIAGVSAGRGGLVQRVATNRVYESKGEAEQIASRHAADRARRRVDEQANEQLYKSHTDYKQKFRLPLERLREFPPLLKFSTTETNLLVKSLQANASQLAAPNDPPPITVENDLLVQAHESYVNQLANALLGGVTLEQEEVESRLIELRGEVPEQLKSDDQNAPPWTIEMQGSKPIILKITDDGFRFTFRGRRYTAGDLTMRAMDVTAEYKAQIDGPGVKLVRQGELEIFPAGFVVGKDTLRPREIGWREKLRKRFGKIFEPEIKSEGLILPGKWRNVGRLDLKQLHLKGGWAALAWIESGVPAPPEKPKPEKPAQDRVAKQPEKS
jgi:hypothetical protein